MRGMIIGVQRQIGLDPFEARDNTGQRAYVTTEARNRGRGRNAAVTAARHHDLTAFADLDWRGRAARVAQLLVTALRTLRAGCHMMFDDGRAQEIEAHDVII